MATKENSATDNIDVLNKSHESASDNPDTIVHPIKLETKFERDTRYRSIRVVQVAMFIFAIGFSIILTGVYPYMKQLTPAATEDELLSRYGWVVSANPLGQMVAAPFFGWLNEKTGSVRLVGLVTSAAYIGGNILYSLLALFPEGDVRYWMLLTSRFIVGASSGNAATIRSYVAEATFTSERTSQMSIISSFQSLGFTIGPGIQAALTPLQCTNTTGQEQYFSFDMYTSAGWVSALVGTISFGLFLPCIFKEIDVSKKERFYHIACEQKSKKGTGSMSSSTNVAETGGGVTSDEASVDRLPNPDYLAAIICIFTFFTYIFNFVLVETLGTPMCMDQFGWTEETTVLYFGILIAASGIMCVLLFGIIGPLGKRFDERKILIFLGIVVMFIGRLVMFPIPGQPLPPSPGNGTEVGLRNSQYYSWADHEPLPLPWTMKHNHSRAISTYETFLRSMSNMNKNIPCDEAQTAEPGCTLEWCEYTPAVTVLQLFGGIVIGTIGYPFCVGITQALFSKILGPRPQGIWMGVLSAFGSLSRVLGPIFVSYIYKIYGTYPVIAFMAGSIVVALILTLAVYKRLIPMQIIPAAQVHRNSENEQYTRL